MVRTFDCQCKCCSPGLKPSVLQHSGIWGSVYYRTGTDWSEIQEGWRKRDNFLLQNLYSLRDGTFHSMLHCTDNSKHIFPEMKLICLVPNFYIHVSVSDLYIPTIVPRQTYHCSFGNNKAAQLHFWEYINLNQTFILDSDQPFICSVAFITLFNVWLCVLDTGGQSTDSHDQTKPLSVNTTLQWGKGWNLQSSFLLSLDWA